MDTTDILIHLHPELPATERAKVEQEVRQLNGVISANFDHHRHPHALIVLYNPDAVASREILDRVRTHDPDAAMVGL